MRRRRGSRGWAGDGKKGEGEEQALAEHRMMVSSPLERDIRRKGAMRLSIVVPLFNEAGNIGELLRRITTVMESLPDPPAEYEIVCVDDGSRDTTRALLYAAADADRHVRVLALSRNFGHQLAATAGVEAARGDAVVLMDGDLQDPPELIAAFIERYRAGYDVVYATRRNRAGESRFKLLTAAVFYRTVRRLTNVSIPVDTGDFRLMSRRVVEALRLSRERHRFIRGLVSWVGFNQIGVEYDRDPRFSGETKYPISKMMRFALDGITAFSEIPLRFASYLGFTVSTIAFLVAIAEIGVRIFTGYNLPGYTSTIFAILFLGGVQLIGIGILGEYIGRIYDQVKGRPLYLVAESVGSGLSGGAEPSGTPGTR
jgi:glycosyltransferase involved in cell wall biosynthesis